MVVGDRLRVNCRCGLLSVGRRPSAVGGLLSPKAGGVEAAQGLVKARQLAILGVVGHQGDNIPLLTEHVLDEAAQGALGADFDEDPRAGGVHRL